MQVDWDTLYKGTLGMIAACLLPNEQRGTRFRSRLRDMSETRRFIFLMRALGPCAFILYWIDSLYLETEAHTLHRLQPPRARIIVHLQIV